MKIFVYYRYGVKRRLHENFGIIAEAKYGVTTLETKNFEILESNSIQYPLIKSE